jgi:hypothetical protein
MVKRSHCLAEKIEKLIELQVNYEMNLVSSGNLKGTIRKEIILFLDWIGDRRFNLIIPRDKSELKFKELIKNLNFSPEILELIKKSIASNYKILEKDNARLNELIDKELFLKTARETLSMKSAREKIIHFVVNSSAYSRMMSSIIYASLKDFLSQNPLTKNNPMATSFLKIGQDLLNNLPGMQGNFDSTIMDFLRNSLAGRIQESEKLIKEELDAGKNTDELLNEIWNFLGTIKVSDLKNLLPEKEVQSFVEKIPSLWEFTKTSGLTEKYSMEQFNEIYLYFGDKTISDIFKEFGVTKEGIANDISESITLFIDTDDFKIYYKSRIDERIRNFYKSEAVEKLIG